MRKKAIKLITTSFILFILQANFAFAAGGEECKTAGGKCLESKLCGSDDGQKDCQSNEICCKENLCVNKNGSCMQQNGTDNDVCSRNGKNQSGIADTSTACWHWNDKNGDWACCVDEENKKCEGETLYCATKCNEGDTPATGSTYTGCKTDESCCEKKSSSDDDNSSGNQSSEFDYKNPLSVESITEWFKNLLASIQGIVGWLAVIMIVVGGIVYITSGGSSSQTTLGKQIIIWALVGFAIAVAAPSLLKEIVDLAKSGSQTTSDVIKNANPVKQIVTNVLEFMLVIIGVLALLGFAISGVMYVSAAGDKQRADTAKNAALYSIIAVCLAGAGLAIIKQVLDLIGTKTS